MVLEPGAQWKSFSAKPPSAWGVNRSSDVGSESAGNVFLLTIVRAGELEQRSLLRLRIRTGPHFGSFVVRVVDQR